MSDDMTNVPDVVRKQAEEAMRLFNAASQAAADAGHPFEGKAPDPPAEPAAETPAEPAAPAEPEKKDDAPAEASAPQPKAPASLASVATEEMTKEQRYKIMEGIQKAAGRDLSRAQAETRALRAELAALQEQISAMSASRPPAKAAAQEPPTGDTAALREQVAEAFGAENVERFFKLMREEGFVARKDLEEVRGEVNNVTKSIGHSAQEKFNSTMDDLAPGWLQINQDPKFIEYMNEEEGHTGMSRLEFAKLHLERHDAPRLAKYFVDYGSMGASDEPAAPAKLDKKKFAAPPSTPSRGKEPEEKTEVTTVKASDMARFAKDVIIGKYRGDEAALTGKDAETWKMYLSAQRANRVVEDK